MKKMFTMIGAIILSANIFATQFAIVDAEAVLKKYPETEKTNVYLEGKKLELEKKIEPMKVELLKKQKELQDKGENLTKEDAVLYKNMEEAYFGQLEALQVELNKIKENMYDKLRSDLNLAVKEIAKDKKIDVVIGMESLYYLNPEIDENITDDVIDFLTGVEKINLD